MERLNTTWNDFCNQIIQKDLKLEVSSTFVFHEEQTKSELATFGWEIKKSPIGVEKISRQCRSSSPQTFHPDQQGRQKPARSCKYCHKNGHTQNWCPKKMHDEEVRKVWFQMSFRRKTIPIPISSASNLNRRPQNDHTMSHFPDQNDTNNPTNELLSSEELNRQFEAEQFTTLEPAFFSRSIGMSFDIADNPSIDESDDESPDPLPLGY